MSLSGWREKLISYNPQNINDEETPEQEKPNRIAAIWLLFLNLPQFFGPKVSQPASIITS